MPRGCSKQNAHENETGRRMTNFDNNVIDLQKYSGLIIFFLNKTR